MHGRTFRSACTECVAHVGIVPYDRGGTLSAPGRWVAALRMAEPLEAPVSECVAQGGAVFHNSGGEFERTWHVGGCPWGGLGQPGMYRCSSYRLRSCSCDGCQPCQQPAHLSGCQALTDHTLRPGSMAHGILWLALVHGLMMPRPCTSGDGCLIPRNSACGGTTILARHHPVALPRRHLLATFLALRKP